MSVVINPKGSRLHDQILQAKINNTTMNAMEQLLGDRHGTGVENKSSAEWYLMTDHGPATINDWWAYNDGEFAIHAANGASALSVVEYFRQHGIQAFCLYGEMT